MKSARLFLIPAIACESQVFNYGVLFSEEKSFMLSQDCSVRVPDYLLSCGEEVLGYLTGTNTLNERKMRIALDSVVDDDNVQNPAFRIFKSSLEAELEASEIYRSYRARVPPSPARTPQDLSAPNKKQKTAETSPQERDADQRVVPEESSEEQPASPPREEDKEQETEQSEEGTLEDGPHWASFHHKKGTKTIYLTGIGCSVDGKMFSAEFEISRYSNKKVEIVPYFDFANLDEAVEGLRFSTLCTVLMNNVYKGDWKYPNPKDPEIAALSFVNVFDMTLSVLVMNIRDWSTDGHLRLINLLVLTGTTSSEDEAAEALNIAVHRRYLIGVHKNKMESEAAVNVSEKLMTIGMSVTSSNLVDLYYAEFDLLNFSFVRSLYQRSLNEPIPKCDDGICDYEDPVEGEEDEDEDADEEEEEEHGDEEENEDEATEVADADED